MLTLKEACDACMPRRKYNHISRKSQFWWTPEIAGLRKTDLATRRTNQRAKRRGHSAVIEHTTLKKARSNLKLAIRRSQETCWRALCTEVERDPWGTPYRVAMRKIGRQSPVPKLMIPLIVDDLFPTHPTPARVEHERQSSY